MSLSPASTPSSEHPKVPQFTVSAIPSVPPPAKKEQEQPTAAAPQNQQPAAAAPAAEAAAAAPTASATPKPKIKWMDALLDTGLVLAVVGVLGGGAYYLKTEWNKYRVPTIMELAYSECEQLIIQREKLQDAYNHADEQQLMRNKLAALEDSLRKRVKEESEVNASIADHQSRILALQHEIRRADRDARSVARGLLPGLPVGDVTTTRGKTYSNATISRLNGNRLTLRTPYGAASVPLNELVKDKLPTIALYALGMVDLVDMSDFTATGDTPPATTKPNPKLHKPAETRRPAPSQVSYEPTPAAPVVDTQGNRNPLDTGDTVPVRPRSADDVWRAPTGDLPL